MTTREFIGLADEHPVAVCAAFLLPPALAWLCSLLHGKDRGGQSPWKYFYSVLVYAACVPGLFSSVVTAYTLFFSRENLMDVNLLVYLLPIVSMIVTLVIIRKHVSFDDVPGFDRLSGLMVMIGCSFGVMLAIDKTRIFVWFGGSIEKLFLLAAGVFALLKWGAYMLFRSGDEPKKPLPNLRDE